MPSPMKRRLRPPSAVRSAYSGSTPASFCPRRASSTIGSRPAENAFHHEETHANVRKGAPGWRSSTSAAQSLASGSSGPEWRDTSSMREVVLHGACHAIDVIVVERLVAGELENLATQAHHLGKLRGVAGRVVAV